MMTSSLGTVSHIPSAASAPHLRGVTQLPPAAPAARDAVAPTGVRPPGTIVDDLTEASRLLERGVEMLGTLPRDDVGSDATKDLRIRIFKTNASAQSRLEAQLTTTLEADVVSILRRADASLEDANWQLAKKPSPDGRFNGVDVPGAIRDTTEGARLVNELLAKLTPGGGGGAPPTPPTTPPAPPTSPPMPPTTPPTPPSTPPAPPTTPVPPTTPAPVPPGGDDYPGEGEFPGEVPDGYEVVTAS